MSKFYALHIPEVLLPAKDRKDAEKLTRIAREYFYCMKLIFDAIQKNEIKVTIDNRFTEPKDYILDETLFLLQQLNINWVRSGKGSYLILDITGYNPIELMGWGEAYHVSIKGKFEVNK